MRLVVFGWGNDARADDALGPLLLRRIEAMQLEDVETIEDYQLQIEHALDLVGFDLALFIDASFEAPAPFRFAEIAPRATRTPTSHALAPEAVLDVFVQLQGRPPPPAFLLAVRGESFGLGEALSVRGVANLTAAGLFCDRLMAERALDRWRDWAGGASEEAASCSLSQPGASASRSAPRRPIST
jgi:hydrogenase maturation protease